MYRLYFNKQRFGMFFFAFRCFSSAKRTGRKHFATRRIESFVQLAAFCKRRKSAIVQIRKLMSRICNRPRNALITFALQDERKRNGPRSQAPAVRDEQPRSERRSSLHERQPYRTYTPDLSLFPKHFGWQTSPDGTHVIQKRRPALLPHKNTCQHLEKHLRGRSRRGAASDFFMRCRESVQDKQGTCPAK